MHWSQSSCLAPLLALIVVTSDAKKHALFKKTDNLDGKKKNRYVG